MNDTNKRETDFENERISPAYVTDNDTGMKYELDFSRESVKFAENRGFRFREFVNAPATGIEDFFFYSFRKNHPNVPKEKVDKLREKWNGVPEALLNRLVLLYNQAESYNTIQTDKEAEKNVHVTLEL